MARALTILLLGVPLLGLALWWGYSRLFSMEAVDAGSAVGPGYRLEWQACDFAVPPDTEVDCARLQTPEADGGFSLPVMVLRYGGDDRREDPLLYLQGGPGAGAGIDTEGLEHWRYWRDYVGLRRDLILLDRRGTGGSNPRFVCREYEQQSRQMLARNLSADAEQQQALAALRQCLREDLPAFSAANFGTRASARDIRALMDFLQSGEPWNLLGVSYGSRLAMEVAHEAPGLRALVLDSAYPPGRGGLDTWPALLGEALEGFYRACQAETECNGLWRDNNHGFESIEQALLEAMEQLQQQPQTVAVTLDHWPEELVVNDHRLLAAIFSASYQRHRWRDALAAILAVHSGERQPLQPLMQAWVRQAFAPGLNSLAFLAVDCRDNALGSEEVFAASAADYPQVADYTRAARAYSICVDWPADDPLQLPEVTVPVALLAGEFDPITPLHWARWLHQRWPASELVSFADTAHSVLGSEPCALAKLGDYLDNPEQGWPRCDQ